LQISKHLDSWWSSTDRTSIQKMNKNYNNFLISSKLILKTMRTIDTSNNCKIWKIANRQVISDNQSEIKETNSFRIKVPMKNKYRLLSNSKIRMMRNPKCIPKQKDREDQIDKVHNLIQEPIFIILKKQYLSWGRKN